MTAPARSVRRYAVLLAGVLLVAGCAEVDSVADQAAGVKDKAAVCAEALGIVDLNPLVDPDKVKQRAEDKERRLRELAENVSDKDVAGSLVTLADSYVEVQKNRFEDISVITDWAGRNLDNVDALRAACT